MEKQTDLEHPLKLLREEIGLSQERFAQLLSVSPKTIWRWENGNSSPCFKPGQWRILLASLETVGLTLDNLPDELVSGARLVR